MKSPLLILAIAVAQSLAGQSWEVFDMATAGFPSNTVLDIAIDSQDHVWAATDWGLCHYDGATWSIFQTTNSGLPDNELYAVAVDSLDRVWIGTEQHGVVIYDGVTWEVFNTLNSGLPDNEIRNITFDHRGWAWIGTYLGLVCYTGSEWRLYNDTPGSYGGLQLTGNVINEVAVREDGLLAIATLNGGFHYVTDTSVVVHSPFIDLFPDNTQTAVVFDTINDERWIATPTQGLLRQGGTWDSGPWFYYTTMNSTIPSNALTCLTMDPTGRPWIGTTGDGFMVRENSGAFVNYTSGNSGLPDNTIMQLRFEQGGALWAATYYGGAARFVQSGSGIANDMSGVAWSAFPNPCGGQLTVRFAGTNAPAGTTWRLLDASGRTALTGALPEGGTLFLDMTALAPGPYLFSITGIPLNGAAWIIKE